MTFSNRQVIRFAHVDAAGIVFYPRYFEMLNATVEDYFAALGVDFATMHLRRGIGVPTVSIAVDFSAPSRLGDELSFQLAPVHVGRSSAEFEIAGTCDGQLRLSGKIVLVCMDLATAKAREWPDDIKPKQF